MSERSEGPSKRQKLDSDAYSRTGSRPSSYSDTTYLNQLEGKLDAKRSEISELHNTLDQVRREKQSLENVLGKVSSSWAKIICDIDAVVPQGSFVKDVMISIPVMSAKEDDLMSVLHTQRRVIKEKVRAILDVVMKNSSQRTEERHTNYNNVISEFASRTIQLEVAYRTAQRAKEDAERTCEQLRSELNSVLMKNRQPQQRQRGKDTPTDDVTKPYRDDVTKLKSELESVNRARVSVEEQMSRLSAELRVSEERFMASKTFQKLSKAVQVLLGKVTQLNMENCEMRKVLDELDDRVNIEAQKIRKVEESKRESIDQALLDLQRKYENECQEKLSILSELDALRRFQTHNARLKDTEAILAQREAEVDSLKRRLKENKAAREDLEGKVSAGVVQIGEMQRELAAKDAQLSDLQSHTHSPGLQSPNDLSQTPLQARLSQYRDEQVKLRDSVRKLESDLTAVKYKLTHAQNRLANEKSNGRKLAEDLENIEKAYEQAMRQNKNLNAQAKSQEAKIGELAIARQAENHCQLLVETQLKDAQERINTLIGVISAQERLIKELEQAKIDQESIVKSLQTALKDLEAKMREAEKRLGTDIRSHDAIEAVKQEALDRCRSLEKQLILGATESAQMRFALSQAEQQITALQSELAVLQVGNETQRDTGLVEEVERLRSMVECRDCRKRLKSIVIAKCLHGFCRECVERKGGECPKCKQKFEEGDLRVINWE